MNHRKAQEYSHYSSDFISISQTKESNAYYEETEEDEVGANKPSLVRINSKGKLGDSDSEDDEQESQGMDIQDYSFGYSIYFYHSEKRMCFTYATAVSKDLCGPFVNILNAHDHVMCEKKQRHERKKFYFAGPWIMSTLGFYENVRGFTLDGHPWEELVLRDIYIQVDQDFQWHEEHTSNGVKIHLTWFPPTTQDLSEYITSGDGEFVLDQRGQSVKYVWDISTSFTKTKFTKRAIVLRIDMDDKTNKHKTVSKHYDDKLEEQTFHVLHSYFCTKKTGECFTYAPDKYETFSQHRAELAKIGIAEYVILPPLG